MKNICFITALLLVGPVAYAGAPARDKNPSLMVQGPGSPDWTGFYVGAFAGYKYSGVDHDLALGGTFDQIPFVKDPLEARGSGDLNNDGAELGGLLGFNYQLRQVVFGLEAAGGYLWARKSSNTGSFELGQGVPPLEIRTSFKTHYLITLAPRIGFACGRFLPYVTGGMAIGDLDFSQRVQDLDDPASRIVAEKTQTNVGWMVGGGLQYAFSQHWSGRIQYQYIDLGHVSLDARVMNNPDFRSHHDASLTEHNASFALIYQF